ncbi:type II toxin-antitoxin system Phd/YefM family antitoxin [Actinomycetospora sp. TBRC 11914]|uniref:type II toxin-antitoxin system Phd/YefM family antitoxin n=1 Tax=Actinomycetospora sp. TBRC 11914 TaxID=2729387 RepID=UPI00145F4CF8|nr:type II toxin-antitoxin system prevent-host-death family antitoxin [Actinomycetospora sp. TBRC 11914]NMO92996.1 type II toxin-antitoxin system prevent-host-death family antitoxin [Actinomycetospora sp. TBRC 11914]
MGDTIGQRELRNDSGAIMRRVEQGESFVVTRNGRPVADLVPHARPHDEPRRTLGELQHLFRELPPVDAARWRAERTEADELLGDDDPIT